MLLYVAANQLRGLFHIEGGQVITHCEFQTIIQIPFRSLSWLAETGGI